jgi:hypothetical protein
MNKFISVVVTCLFLFGSVVGASAITLVWNTPDSGVPAGYVLSWGPSEADVTSGGQVVVEPASSCVGGVDNGTTPPTNYDCKAVANPTLSDNQVIWFAAKAFNYSTDGNSQISSEFSNKVKYTHQTDGGQPGTKPGPPRTVRFNLGN